MVSSVSRADERSTSGTAAGAGRKGFKAELADLRERMRGLGLGYEEIAGELARRYRLRPREAYRLAWGWTLDSAAARFNACAASEGTDPRARASLTGSRLCEYERWPSGGRRPSVYVLLMLARIYESGVLCLLDLADHEQLAPQDRLVLIRPPQLRAGTVAGDAASGGHAVIRLPGDGEGLSLSLPYVPGRVVIEVSGQVGDTVQLAGGGDVDTVVAGGQLILLRGAVGGAGTGVAGA